MRRSLSLVVLILIGGSDCAQRIASTRSSVERSSYIVRLGIDTIMVETFTVADGTIEGDIVDRSPTTSVLHYELAADARGRVNRLQVTLRAAPGAPAMPRFRTTVAKSADGFDIAIEEGDSTLRRHVVAPPDAIPLFSRSIGLYELVTARLRRSGGDSLIVPVLHLDSIHVSEQAMRRLGADSVLLPLYFPRGEHARVDATGRILGVSGLETSYKWLTQRESNVDVAALSRSFAARDAGGASFGSYSLRDTVRAVVDGARITIDYGRPSKRGRVIFGGLVPWGNVWRTGADLATHFTTDHALDLNGLIVPPGTFTLYTIPSPTTWTLIVNRRTGQLGLVYDPIADLGRAPMTTMMVRDVTERLTITLSTAPSGGGMLRVAWDQLVASVPFHVVVGSAP